MQSQSIRLTTLTNLICLFPPSVWWWCFFFFLLLFVFIYSTLCLSPPQTCTECLCVCVHEKRERNKERTFVCSFSGSNLGAASTVNGVQIQVRLCIQSSYHSKLKIPSWQNILCTICVQVCVCVFLCYFNKSGIQCVVVCEGEKER